MYVNEMIGNDYFEWGWGDSVFMETPTGTGKSTFILEVLLPYVKEKGKEILYLSNRFLLKEQIKMEIARKQNLPTEREWLEEVEEFDGITVLSYQKLQEKCKKGRAEKYKSERYDLIVWDEAHYIIEDSAFNPDIVWILEFLKSVGQTCIFISATMYKIKKNLADIKYRQQVFWYTLEKKSEYLKMCYADSIYGQIFNEFYRLWFYKFEEKRKFEKVLYFADFGEVCEKIRKSSFEEKWLIFMSNKAKAKKLQNELEGAVILSADERKGEVLEEILVKQFFSCRILIATKLLDNGVTLKDVQLKHLVVDTMSKTEFLQMVGRKRLVNENDKAILYIPQKETRYFSGYQQTGLKEVQAVLQEEWTTDKLIKKFYENPAFGDMIRRFFCWKNGKFVKNPMAILYYSEQEKFVERMIQEMKNDEWRFVKEQLTWLGLQDTFDENNSLLYEQRIKAIEQIKNHMGSLCGKELEKEAQMTLRRFINEIVKAVDIQIAEGKRLAGLSLLNKFLEEWKIPFYIKSREGKKKGMETIWTVQEVEGNVLACEN